MRAAAFISLILGTLLFLWFVIPSSMGSDVWPIVYLAMPIVLLGFLILAGSAADQTSARARIGYGIVIAIPTTFILLLVTSALSH